MRHKSNWIRAELHPTVYTFDIPVLCVFFFCIYSHETMMLFGTTRAISQKFGINAYMVYSDGITFICQCIIQYYVLFVFFLFFSGFYARLNITELEYNTSNTTFDNLESVGFFCVYMISFSASYDVSMCVFVCALG